MVRSGKYRCVLVFQCVRFFYGPLCPAYLFMATLSSAYKDAILNDKLNLSLASSKVRYQNSCIIKKVTSCQFQMLKRFLYILMFHYFITHCELT